MNRLILASKSPRRKEILEKLGLEFEIIPSGYKENLQAKKDPVELAKFLSLNKAKDVANKIKGNAIIIAADTFIVLEGKFLGKPKDDQDAKKMLNFLSGKTHEVITGIALIDTSTNQKITDVSITKVTFKSLSSKEIQTYINTGEPLGKAGAYAIQEKGAVFVSNINGDFFTVMGLPLHLLAEHLKNMSPSSD
ncbi:septum formation inhibitor Maf [Candidatus Peregrinibacteria bacterium]|jgi:septum formation protein|nr:septum formation inhibitor Maf [Candidatus Peregrinibacteria bacterium]MBT7483441.1 septum formation inhibitor Maf [Candidatus Peregrinibacteria bacterium]MBT7703263.1 septum formation inhibitor Maf [Candidatus Peregrinibacteria bacterium]